MTDTQPMSRADLLGKIEAGWNTLQAYLNTLTEDQLTQPTDARGWTVKDHLVHLVAWEDSVNALLAKQPRGEQMGLDKPTWESGDFDLQNAILQQREQKTPLAEVLKTFQQVHRRLLAGIQSLTDADLARPYRDFQSDSTSDSPMINTIIGNTYAHYEEHQPWIEAIVTSGKSASVR